MGKFSVLKTMVDAEGGRAFALDREVELFSAVSTSFVDDTFYGRKDDRMKRLRGLIAQADPAFVCRLAVFVRREMNLRSIPLVLLVELLGTVRRKETSFDRRMIGWAPNAVILRADEISEVLAYYQLAKQTLFDKIAEQTLQGPCAWETQLSTRGNSKEVWEQLIDSGKADYMALLRNLKNILDAGLDEERMEQVAAKLEDPDQVRRSRQLPVRFLSAYLEVQDMEAEER
jgi:60 kDa SS-A/Ro ribonucleoprotein